MPVVMEHTVYLKHFRLCQALVHTASPSPLAAGSLPEMTPCHPHHLLCPPPLAARRSCTSARSWSTCGTLPWPAPRPATCPSSPGPGPAPTDQSVAPSRQDYLSHRLCETKLIDVLSIVQIGECVLLNCVVTNFIKANLISNLFFLSVSWLQFILLTLVLLWWRLDTLLISI